MNSILDGLGTSQKIKALMAVKGITQQALADTVGVSLWTIQNRFEHGQWTVAEVREIAAEYGVNIQDFL